MSRCESEGAPVDAAPTRCYVVSVLGLLAVMAAGGIAFFLTQNGSGRIGGEMAPQKMLWLFYAIVLWLVLPGAVVFDRRASPPIRAAYCALFALMVLRAIAEGWMLYVSRNWSPWYGIGHDVVCMVVGLVAAVSVARSAGIRRSVDRWLYANLVVTLLAFVPEIHFAHYMVGNFNTAGEAAIYFVPDDARHREVLGMTSALVTFLTLYLPVFIWGWLVGAAGSKDTKRR